MVALVSVETVLLVLLVLLVAGLLRSHAEILRRLEDARLGRSDEERLPDPPRTDRGGKARKPKPIAGTTPAGDPVALSFGGPGSASTLLAFLTSGCSSCGAFWEALAERRLPARVQTVIVTHGPERERPKRIRALAPDGVPVVMASEAWEDYEVPGSPYFVLVDDEIRGEGVATTWQAMASLVGDAIDDSNDARGGRGGLERARAVDDTLIAAGIGPDHPSLRPGTGTGDEEERA